jgi:hypothetical protein
MRRFALLLLAGFLSSAADARDLALVIGNDSYTNIPALKKAVNDAGAIAGELEKLGFIVRRAENLDQRAMSRTLVAFDNDIGPGDRAFFFYAGHGFEIDGINYLLPTDVPAADTNQQNLIRDASFPVSRIIDGIRARGASVAVLVLDACRNSPFQTTGRSGLATRGLARVDAPDGVFVLMSAGTKQEALDRLSDADPDPNSLFTRAFLQELQKPGQTLVQVAKRTQVAVKELAATVGHEQTPAYYDQVIGDVVLASADAGEPEPIVAGDDPQHVSGNVKTQIQTSGDTQAGAGVSMGAGVTLGPGVIIGGKDAKIAVENPANAPKGDPAAREVIAQGGVPADTVQTAMLPNPGAVGAPGERLTGSAPIASFMRSNAGWTVTLSTPEPAIAIAYRLGEAGEFRETGLLDVLDQRTGQRMPNPSFPLSGKAKATIIEVRYRTADGSVVGPFPIRFDPAVALFDTQRKSLEMIWPSWVEFREYNGLLVYFSTLLSYRCAITEVRYGLDGAAPLRRFNMPACDEADPFSIPESATIYLELPEKTASISLQLTWRDGTQSEINTIER